MEPIKVSIIVPCYGVEAYLERCIRSLACQSLEEIEILAIDDASPDRCGEMLEEMQKEVGPRMRVFHKENGGLSHTRNYGMERARGEYVAFLDGDDYVDLDLYEQLYLQAKETGADVVAFPVRYEYPDGRDMTVASGIPEFAEGEKLKRVFTSFYPSACNKIYKRSLISESDVCFQNGVWFEDVEWMHRLFPYIRRVASIDSAVLHYVQREGSITSTADPRLFDYIRNFEGILAFYRERGLIGEWEKELEYVSVRYLLATFLKRAAAFEEKEFDRAVTEATGFLNREFPRWRRNPYLWKNGLKGLYLRFFSPRIAGWMRRGQRK